MKLLHFPRQTGSRTQWCYLPELSRSPCTQHFPVPDPRQYLSLRRSCTLVSSWWWLEVNTAWGVREDVLHLVTDPNTSVCLALFPPKRFQDWLRSWPMEKLSGSLEVPGWNQLSNGSSTRSILVERRHLFDNLNNLSLMLLTLGHWRLLPTICSVR